jgi:hypothetical protein
MSKRQWKTPLYWTIVGILLGEALSMLISGSTYPQLTPTLLAIAVLFALEEIVHTIKRRRRLQLLTLAGLVFVLSAMTVWPEIGRIIDRSPNLEIHYHGQKLQGRPIMLAKSCAPASPIQPDMCIDQNYPNNFDLFGIAVFADGSVKAHYALAEFSTKVTVPSLSWSCWKPVDTAGTQYGCFLNEMIIPARLQVAIEPFYGTPLPSPQMDVTVSVFYGPSKTARATFVVRTPK